METAGRKLQIFPPLLEPDLPSLGCPGDSVGKESACNVEDPGLIPGSERFPGGGNDNSILAWRIPWTEEPGRLQSMGVTKSRTQMGDKHIVDHQNCLLEFCESL